MPQAPARSPFRESDFVDSFGCHAMRALTISRGYFALRCLAGSAFQVAEPLPGFALVKARAHFAHIAPAAVLGYRQQQSSHHAMAPALTGPPPDDHHFLGAGMFDFQP